MPDDTLHTIETDAGDFTLLAHGSEHTDPGAMEDPVVTHLLLCADEVRQATGPRMRRALEEYFAPGRCGCSHDCCGHRFGVARAEPGGDMQTWIVRVSTARNF